MPEDLSKDVSKRKFDRVDKLIEKVREGAEKLEIHGQQKRAIYNRIDKLADYVDEQRYYYIENGAEQDRIRRAEQEKRNHEGHINSWVNTFKEYFDKGLTVDEIKVAMITRSSNTTPGHVLHNPHFLADDVISEIATRTGIPLEDVQAVVDFGKVEHLKDMDRNRKDAEEYQRRKENTKELWIEGDHVRRFVGDYGPVLLKKVVNDLRRSEQ